MDKNTNPEQLQPIKIRSNPSKQSTTKSEQGFFSKLYNTTFKNNEGEYRFEIDPVSSVLLVIVFSIERTLSYFAQRRLNRNTWYLEIIVKPNQVYIDKYFKSTARDTKDALSRLRASSTTLTHALLSREIAVEMNNIKKKCSQIESKFIDYSLPLGDLIYENLLNNILEMKDKLSNTMDHQNFASTSDQQIDIIIHYYKSNFFQLLYLPIKRGIFRTALFNTKMFFIKIYKKIAP